MKYAAVFIQFMRAAPAALAPAVAVGAWTRLYVHAAIIEMQGRIPKCAAYTDREWMVTAAVTAAEVADALAAGLVRWEGDDLLVLGYDLEGEAKVAACRVNGNQPPRPGSRPRGRPRKGDGKPTGKPNEKPAVIAQKMTQRKPSENPSPTSPCPPSPSDHPHQRDEHPPNVSADGQPDPLTAQGLRTLLAKAVLKAQPQLGGHYHPGQWAAKASSDFFDAIPAEECNDLTRANIRTRIGLFAACTDDRITKGSWSVEAFCDAFNRLAAAATGPDARRPTRMREISDLEPAGPRPASKPSSVAASATTSS